MSQNFKADINIRTSKSAVVAVKSSPSVNINLKESEDKGLGCKLSAKILLP